MSVDEHQKLLSLFLHEWLIGVHLDNPAVHAAIVLAKWEVRVQHVELVADVRLEHGETLKHLVRVPQLANWVFYGCQSRPLDQRFVARLVWPEERDVLVKGEDRCFQHFGSRSLGVGLLRSLAESFFVLLLLLVGVFDGL